MADTTTLAKAFVKPEIGSHPDTWGNVLNDNYDLLDRTVAGVAAFAVSGNFTLSAAQAQNLTYEISGALSADAVITFPVYRGFAFIRNLTTGGHQLIIQMSTGGASIPVAPGLDRLCVGDGTDFFSNVLAVAKTGDTMTGPLTINTAAGTNGLVVSSNTVLNGNYLYLNNGGGLVNNIGGPFIYTDNVNFVLKIPSGNGSFIFQNYGGTGTAALDAGGDFKAATLTSSVGPITSADNFIGTSVTFPAVSGGNHGFNFRWDGVSVWTRVDNATEYPIANAYNLGNYLPLGGGTLSGGLEISHGNLSVDNGEIHCAGAGIYYDNVGNHGFNFRWDGATTFIRIDNAREIAIADATSLGNYLPLSGGTITGTLTVHSGGTAILANNGDIQAIGDLYGHRLFVSGSVNVNGVQISNNTGWLYTPSNIWSDGEIQALASGTAFYAPNGNVVCPNIQTSNDICAGGVFRNYILGTGPKGARIECWNGSGWDAMSFAIISGGYLGVSPDQGSSGFNYAPNGSWSDARLKTNIRDSEVDALAVVRSIPLRAFEWNEEGRKLMHRSGPVLCGFVAQDLEEQIPVAVDIVPVIGDLTGGGMRNVLDQHLTPYLFRAIQQIADRLEALEAPS